MIYLFYDFYLTRYIEQFYLCILYSIGYNNVHYYYKKIM